MKKAILAIFLTVALPMFAIKPSLADQEVKLGLQNLSSYGVFFVGMDKGFFNAEGLTIKPLWFKAAQPITVATSSGDLDVAGAGTVAGLWNSIGSGMKIRAVAGRSWEWPGYKLTGLITSAKSYDQGVKTIKDLRGKRVGITQFGSTFHYNLGKMVEGVGMSLKDFTLVPLGGVSTMRDTVLTDKIESAFLVEPFITPLVQDNKIKVISWASDAMRYNVGVVIYGEKFIKNRTAAVAFMRGYIKSCQYYYDNGLMKKDQKAYQEILSIIAKYTGEKPDNLAISMAYNVRNGEIDPKEIQNQLDWWYANGLVEKKLSSADVIDDSFLKEAMK
jgi:NitT/TauT family transport system substrate-binding protein